MLSSAAEASSAPSGEYARARIVFLCPFSVARSLRPATSQSFTTRSLPAEASVLPSGAKATARTDALWPVKLAISFASATSQSFTSLS